MMLYEIKHWNGNIIVRQKADSLKAAIELLVGRGAVLRGADLHGAVLRGADLSGAVLRGADLHGAVLRGADLSGAVLRGADLSGAVLSDAVLRGADLHGADLHGAVLRRAVLRGADYYKVPDLHTKMLAAIEAGGLEMGSWHTCETTHCRAGWAITLAGNVGKYMESQLGPAAAGAFITLASCPWMEKVPNFYASNETALADIKKCAEREQQEAALHLQ